MSEKCPLCGNYRSENSLFCDNCAKKVQSDYEVELPDVINTEDQPNIDERVDELKPESKEPIKEPIREDNSKYDKDNSNYEDSPIYEDSRNYDEKSIIKNKSGAGVLKVLIAVLLGIGLFTVYNKTIREKNLDRSAWETAVKENSVEGYLTYIESQPSGIHFDEAQEGLMRLKQDEALTWERLKESHNISELTGFITQFESSPYLPLVKIRLDSLSWIAALKTNTIESYNEYILRAQNGELRGDYSGEARKRYGWLYQSAPINASELDSIRTTVSGFYSSITSIDHTGMYRFLAPHVHRFFDSGGVSRERITGELLITAAQSGDARISFAPDLEGVRYERLSNGNYEVNVPLVKSYTSGNSNTHVPGYIVHITLNSMFEINSIYETKPFPDAP